MWGAATISSSSQLSAKDALCVNEYGVSFRTASWLDITALYQSEFYTNERFTIANTDITGAIYVDGSGNGYNYISNPGAVQTVPVACIRDTAPLQFTRATVSSNVDVSSKDALCSAEFGAAYNTASWLDITALYRSVFYTNRRFTIANLNVPGAIYVDGSGFGYNFISNPGAVQVVPVACALR